MAKRIGTRFLFVVILTVGAFSASAQYLVDVTTSYPYTNCGGPACGGGGTFNGATVALAGTVHLNFSTPQPTYTCTMQKVCDAGHSVCTRYNATGDMPSQYKGTKSVTGLSITYCYEPSIPLIGVNKDLATSNVTVSMGMWGFRYVWQVRSGTGAFQTFQTVGDGVTPLTESSVTITPATLASMFGSAYNQNFTFQVIVTGCNARTSTISEGVTITEPAPTVSFVGKTKATCYQSATGTVTISIGNPVVNNFYINCYNRTTNVSFPVAEIVHRGNYTITGLGAGLWDFLVTNDAALAANTWLEDVQVEEPTQVKVNFSAPPYNGYAIKCFGGTGDVTASGTGGEGGYKDFVWNTGVNTATLSGVAAGTYTVTLKDRYDCTSAATPVTLSAPQALSVSATSPRTYGAYEVKCHDQANGTATAQGAGGAGGYSYAWSNGAAGAGISGLAANTYSVTVTDGNGCTAPGSVQLKAPVPIDFTIDQVQGLTCKGDETAIFEAKPVLSTIIGTAKYLWSGGETDATVYDKKAGTYTVTVSDDQGCSTLKSKVLADPPGYTVSLAPGLDYNGALIRCNGDSNGKLVSAVLDASNAQVTAQGYEWSKNGVVFSQGLQTTQEDLGKGNYKIVITYNTVCKAEAGYILSEPDAIAASTTATTSYHGQAISCFNATDGNVKATVTGGTGTYSYLWNTGGTTSLLTGLGAGTYSIVVKDINGCPGSSQITLNNPVAVSASIADVSGHVGYGVSCASSTDGTMTAVASGGTHVYTYSWSNGRNTAVNGGLGAGSYTVTVTDNNGCSAQASQTLTEPLLLEVEVDTYADVACHAGSDGVIRLSARGGAGDYEYTRNGGVNWVPAAEFTGLPIGTYTLAVRDDNGCSASVTQKLVEPGVLGLTFEDVDPAFCADPRGGVTAKVTGGVAGYSYSWLDEDGNVLGTAARLSNVLGGLYIVEVRDAHNCLITDDVGITSTDGAKADYSAISALCHDSSDGSAALTITDGEGPFAIKWPDGQNTLEGKNLKGGNYIVRITDGHDCTVIKQVTIPAPLALALNVPSSTPPTCNGDCDGSLTLQASGGVGVYQYNWNGQTGMIQTNLCQGAYNVVVTDGNGCRLDQQVTLSEPEVLKVSLQSSIQATCTDGCDGKLEVTGEGGNGGYSYSWDGGVAGASRADLCPGEYSVMVTDAKGCVGSNILTLANTAPVAVNLGGGVTLCVGQSYTLNAGAGWSKVQWGGNGSITGAAQQLTVNDPGTYWVEVLNAKGCVGRDTFLLETSYDLLQASFMIPDKAVAGDTVAMIDVSWPLPELAEWSFPSGMNKVSATDEIVLGQFNTTGTHSVGLTARLGECRDYVEKNIVIIDGGEGETGGRLGYEEYVKAFGLYANPNDGSFDVIVNLADTDDIMLSIWNNQTGALVGKIAEKGNASYSLHIDLRPLSSGIYVLRLDHAKGTSYLRFMVK